MARLICKWFTAALLIIYILALAIGLISSFGWFGQDRDPLAWVFVIILRLPLVTWIGGSADPMRLGLAASTPLLNPATVRLIYRLRFARSGKLH